MPKHVAVEGTGAASDYERIGGGRAVAGVVDEFYELVLSDPSLAPFFHDVDMARLKRHQVMLISQALGGPVSYDGRALGEAHAGMGISNDDFGRVVGHLVTAMSGAGVTPDIIERVGGALGAAKADIVTAEVS
jgi:hemoglobin